MGIATRKVRIWQESDHLYETPLLSPYLSTHTEYAFKLLGGWKLRQVMGAQPTMQC